MELDSSDNWLSQHSQHMPSQSMYSCWVISLPQTSQKCFFLGEFTICVPDLILLCGFMNFSCVNLLRKFN